jgi:hypothetical protein
VDRAGEGAGSPALPLAPAGGAPTGDGPGAAGGSEKTGDATIPRSVDGWPATSGSSIGSSDM